MSLQQVALTLEERPPHIALVPSSFDSLREHTYAFSPSLQAALAVAMACFGLDFISIFFGLSIFMMRVRMKTASGGQAPRCLNLGVNETVGSPVAGLSSSELAQYRSQARVSRYFALQYIHTAFTLPILNGQRNPPRHVRYYR